MLLCAVYFLGVSGSLGPWVSGGFGGAGFGGGGGTLKLFHSPGFWVGLVSPGLEVGGLEGIIIFLEVILLGPLDICVNKNDHQNGSS